MTAALLSSSALPTIQSVLARVRMAGSSLLQWPMCLHPELRDQSPPGDLSNLQRQGLSFFFMLAYLSVVASNALRVMLSPTGELRLSDVALGVLVASMICLLDVILFVSGSHYTQGLEQVSRTGQFKSPTVKGAKTKAGLLLAVRIAMAVGTANVAATSVSLEIYGKEINAQITRDYIRANAPVIARATKRVEESIESSERRQQAVTASIAKLDQEIAQLGAMIVDPNVSDPELRTAIDALAGAQAAKAEAEGAVLEAKSAMADELDGTIRTPRRGGPTRSGRIGQGPKYRAAVQRLQAAETQHRSAMGAIAAAEAKIAAIRSANSVEVDRKTSAARTRLANLNWQKAEDVRQLATMTAEHLTRYSDRDRLVQEAIRNDPNYVPREEGLLTRLKALRELMNEPAVAAMVYLLDFLLVLLELAAVLGVSLAFTPSTYALSVFERELKRSVETARRVSEVISGVASVAVAAQPAPIVLKADGSQVEAPAAPLSHDPQPLKGAPERSPRHAARWKPPSTNGESEPPN